MDHAKQTHRIQLELVIGPVLEPTTSCQSNPRMGLSAKSGLTAFPVGTWYFSRRSRRHRR